MQKEIPKKEILALMAKFRSRLDTLWRIVTQICDGSLASGRSIGSYPPYDIPLLPLIGINLEQYQEITRPTYEDAVKIAFETIMSDFYEIEDLIEESF